MTAKSVDGSLPWRDRVVPATMTCVDRVHVEPAVRVKSPFVGGVEVHQAMDSEVWKMHKRRRRRSRTAA